MIPARHTGKLDAKLWEACQRIVYGSQPPSPHPPYAAEVCPDASKRPASWLYHTLANNPELRQKVKANFPANQSHIAALM